MTEPTFTVLSGNPTPVELAAITAVVTAMIDEAENRREPRAEARANAWAQSQRRLRREIVPGPGAWNGDKF